MTGRVMIVDAVATNRILLNVKLSMAFYEVSHAISGTAARAFALDSFPDVILVSDALPDMSTAEFCEMIKSDPRLALTPVVVLTAQRDISMRVRCLVAGADDILNKPVDDDVLTARLRSLLRARETERELQLRDDMSRALGFSEQAAISTAPACVNLITPNASDAALCKEKMAGISAHILHHTHPKEVLRGQTKLTSAEVYVIALSNEAPEEDLQVMLELRARVESRNSAIIVVVPEQHKQLAPRVLDLGANDLMLGRVHFRELAIRVNTQLRRKRSADMLRKNMRAGLRAAIIDPLTDLYNRRYAMPYLAKLFEKSCQTGRQFAVMVADIDHFKQINDQYGHVVGDAVLAHVAHLMRDALRAADLLARIGGEEFLIVMPDRARGDACQAARRICRKIAENPFKICQGDLVIDVTISIGVAMAPDFTNGVLDTPEELLEQADQALYSAKSRGRNQVTLCKNAA